MAGTPIAGEAAVRIVPKLKGFHEKVRTELQRDRIKYDINLGADTSRLNREIEAVRAAQEARAVHIRVKTDWNQLKRDISQVEHIFKRNSTSQALRLNVKIIGLDALPALAYAAAGATSSLDALAKAAFVLPGVLGGALASVSGLAIGMHGVKDAFKSLGQNQKEIATQSRLIADDNRQLERSYRDYGRAVRDTIRDIQDLNAENRRSSLNVADAILGVQEAADRLRQGGQKTILELRRDQLNYLQAVDRLQEVNTKAQRIAEDTADANAKGVQGADKVADALDQINQNIEKLNTDKLDKVAMSMSKVSPNAKATLEAIKGLSGEWAKLQFVVQDKLWAGLDKSIVGLAKTSLPMLETGLGRVNTALNTNLQNAIAALGDKNSQSLVDRIFGNTDVALQKFSVGMKPLVDSLLRTLGESSDFLPRLGDAGAKVAQRFDDWIKRIASDGSLDRWISRGLDAFTALGHSIGNIGSIISSMSETFDKVTGNKGGFLGLLDKTTTRLANFLKSGEGKNTLGKYFADTKKFIGDLGKAITDIRPLISDIIETVRDWSVWMFRAIGGIASFATMVERNTGLLKPLLGMFIAYKTTRPIWDLLKTSFENYEKVVRSAAKNGLGDMPGIQRTLNNLDKMRGKAVEAQNAVAAVEPLQGPNKPNPYVQTAAASTSDGKPAWVSPVVQARENAKAAAERAAAMPGSLADRLASAAVISDTRNRANDAARWMSSQAAIDKYMSALPPEAFPLDAPGQRSSKAKVRKDANRTLRSSQREWFGKYLPTQDAPAMGPMQGPQLPPEIFKAETAAANETAKAVKDVGDASEVTKQKTADLGSASDTTAKNVKSAGDASATAHPKVKDLGAKSDAAATSASKLATNSVPAAKAVSSVGDAGAKAAPGVKSVGDAAKAAADEVGTERIGMRGRLAGLAGALAPGMALMFGITTVMWAIEKMGEAHRKAGDAALYQSNQLAALGDTLNAVTGAFTRQTYTETLAQAQKFKAGSGVFGEVNVLPMIQALGLNGEQLLINASDPTKAMAAQQDISNLASMVKSQVEASPQYQQSKAAFDAVNINSMDIAQALLSDPAALKKFKDAEQASATSGPGGIPMYIPDLAKVGMSLPNKDAFLLGQFLNTRAQAQAARGYDIYTNMRPYARGQFTALGADTFKNYSPNPDNISIDPSTREGMVTLNGRPSQEQIDAWQQQQISVVDEGNGTWSVRISPGEAEKYIARYADGGMVRGPGGPRDDQILAQVSSGEHITNAAAVQYYGADLFHALNSMAVPKFAPGGFPFPLRPVPTPDPGGGNGVGPGTAPPVIPGGNYPVVPYTPPPAAPAPPVAPPALPSAPAANKPGWTYGPDGKPKSAPEGASQSEFFGDLVDWYKANGQPIPPAYQQYDRGSSPAAPAAGAAASTAGSSPFLPGSSPATPAAITPFLPGTALPPSRTGDETGLQVNTIGLKRTIETLFPGIQSIGGFRQDAIADHPSGAAIDVMIPGWDTPQGKAYGDSIAAWLQQNGSALGVESFIWQDTWNPINEGGQAHRLNRQGANEGHYNHIHIKTNGGGYPKGGEQYKMPATAGMAGMPPGLMQVLAGVFPGGMPALLQALPGGGYLGGVTADMLTANGVNGDGKKKDPTTEFLTSLANDAGGTLLSIGTGFLSGITGIDFGSIVGSVQKYAGAAIKAWGPKSDNTDGQTNPNASLLDSILPGLSGLVNGGGSGGGASPGTDAAGAIIGGVVNGQLPLQDPAVQQTLSDTGFNQNLTGDVPVTAGGEASGPVSEADISAAVDQLAPMLGLKNKSAWVTALVKASKGSGKIFETGAASYGTGQQKAVAALMTAVRQWGIDPVSGGPKTPTYAFGGGTGQGLAWLSNGEFRTNPSATSFYGPGLFNALNARAIPKGVAKRMMKGGVPRFDTGGQFGNPGVASSDPMKQTMSQLLYYYGKNNITASDRQHMTPETQMLKEQVAQQFNSEIGQINGWRPPDVTPYGTFTEHSSGQALDVWLNGAIRQSDGQMLPPADPTIGNRVRDFMLSRGADYVLWNQTEFDKNGGQSPMGVRDGTPTMRHTNHDHGRIKPGTKITPQPTVARDLGQLLLPGFAGGGMVDGSGGTDQVPNWQKTWQAQRDTGTGAFAPGMHQLSPGNFNPGIKIDTSKASIISPWIGGGGGFADGGLIPDPLLQPPGSVPGPLPMGAPDTTPMGVAPAPAPAPVDPAAAATQTGGVPGSGATAPAPDPGALPSVQDAAAGIGGLGGLMGGGGLTQPGGSAGPEGDPRANYGAPPTSQDHNSPMVSGAISGIASTIGSAAAMAANVGMMGATMGGSAAIPGAGGMAGAGIQAGAQMAGQIATGAVNILSSLLVGTATGGSTANASGVPLLPQRQPMQTGVAPMGQQYQDNRTYNITNLDEYRALQERDAAQQSNPFIGKF